jgi:hypothetical protein
LDKLFAGSVVVGIEMDSIWCSRACFVETDNRNGIELVDVFAAHQLGVCLTEPHKRLELSDSYFLVILFAQFHIVSHDQILCFRKHPRLVGRLHIFYVTLQLAFAIKLIVTLQRMPFWQKLTIRINNLPNLGCGQHSFGHLLRWSRQSGWKSSQIDSARDSLARCSPPNSSRASTSIQVPLGYRQLSMWLAHSVSPSVLPSENSLSTTPMPPEQNATIAFRLNWTHRCSKFPSQQEPMHPPYIIILYLKPQLSIRCLLGCRIQSILLKSIQFRSCTHFARLIGSRISTTSIFQYQAPRSSTSGNYPWFKCLPTPAQLRPLNTVKSPAWSNITRKSQRK